MLPPTNELKDLVEKIKNTIEPDCLAFEDDEEPGIQLTVGSDGTDWDFQTGDNSFVGGAYGYPHWAVVGISRNSNIAEIAKDIRQQLSDLLNESH